MGKVDLQRELMRFILANADTIYVMNGDLSEMQQLEGDDFLPEAAKHGHKWVEKYIPIYEQPRVRAAIMLAISNKEVFNLEHRVNGIGGQITWSHSRAIPILDDGGNIIKWFGTAKDITCRKSKELNLLTEVNIFEQSEQVYRSGSWEYDPFTNDYKWSNGMYFLFGINRNTIPSPEIYRSFATKDYVKSAQNIASHIYSASKPFDEIIELNINGCIKTLHSKGRIIKNPMDNSFKLTGVDVDITSMRRSLELTKRVNDKKQQENLEILLSAEETDRLRLSQNLYNGVCQILYGVKLALPLLSSKIAVESPEQFEHTRKHVESLLSMAITDSRNISKELTPVIFSDFGLKPALIEIFDQTSRLIEFTYQLELNKIVLPHHLGLIIYRSIKELLEFAQLNASKAELKLVTHGRLLVLEVADNRKAIYQEPSTAQILLKNKISLLRGKWSTDFDEKGTRIKIEFALPSKKP